MSLTNENLNLINDIPQIKLTDTQAYYGEQHDALPILVVESDLCKAVIAIQGAHVIEFVPANEAPLLWVSPKVQYKAAKAIRGGVPICFPWFGENQFDKTKPSHGFVRNKNWALSGVKSLDNQEIELTFTTASDAASFTLFPYEFTAEYKVTLGSSLKLSLSTTNLSDKVMPVSFALHSYHPVSDLSATQVKGLHWTTYLDNTSAYQAHIQQGPVVFDGEVDRIYLNVAKQQTIVTEPAIALISDECKSAIVWNPAFAKADSMADLGGENYQAFVCVERGVAFSDSWFLATGEQKTAHLEITHSC